MFSTLPLMSCDVCTFLYVYVKIWFFQKIKPVRGKYNIYVKWSTSLGSNLMTMCTCQHTTAWAELYLLTGYKLPSPKCRPLNYSCLGNKCFDLWEQFSSTLNRCIQQAWKLCVFCYGLHIYNCLYKHDTRTELPSMASRILHFTFGGD